MQIFLFKFEDKRKAMKKKILYWLFAACALSGCGESKKEVNKKLVEQQLSYQKIIDENKKEIESLKMQVSILNDSVEKLRWRPNERIKQIKEDIKNNELNSARIHYNNLKRYYPNSSEAEEVTLIINQAEEKYEKEEELRKKKERASGTVLGLLLGAESKEDALSMMRKKGYSFQEIGSETYASYKVTNIEGLTWNIVFLTFKNDILSYVGFAKAYNSITAFNNGMVHIITRLQSKYGDPSSDYSNNSVTYRDGRMAIVVSDRDMNGQSYLTLGYNDVYLSNF